MLQPRRWSDVRKHTDRGSEEQHIVHTVETYHGEVNLQTRSPVPPSRLCTSKQVQCAVGRVQSPTSGHVAAFIHRCRKLGGAVGYVLAVRTHVRRQTSRTCHDDQPDNKSGDDNLRTSSCYEQMVDRRTGACCRQPCAVADCQHKVQVGNVTTRRTPTRAEACRHAKRAESSQRAYPSFPCELHHGCKSAVSLKGGWWPVAFLKDVWAFTAGRVQSDSKHTSVDVSQQPRYHTRVSGQ